MNYNCMGDVGIIWLDLIFSKIVKDLYFFGFFLLSEE